MANVLICDDSQFARQVTRRLVENAGHAVVGEAQDGADAVEQYRALRPNLLLVDLVMPRMSGTEAIRQVIGEDPAARILVCSAMGQDQLVSEALAAGARGFVTKPAQPDKLLEALRAALD